MSPISTVSAELERGIRPGWKALLTFGAKRDRTRGSPGKPAVGTWVVDAAMLVASAAATELSTLVMGVSTIPLAWLLVFTLLVLGLLIHRGVYASPRLSMHFLDDTRGVVSATAAATLAVIALQAVLVENPHSATQMLTSGVLAATLLTAGRAGLFSARQRAIRRAGGKPTLIVGAGKVAQLVAGRLLERPEYGLTPVGFLDSDPLPMPAERVPLPVLGASWNLDDAIADRGVEHVIFTFWRAPHEEMLSMVKRCYELGVAVSHVPRLFDVAVERMTVQHLGGLPLVEWRPMNPKGWQFVVKYAVDRVAAAVLLLLLAPVLAIIALAVRLAIGGPVLFRQPRVGLDGCEFEILKFRTMTGRPEKQGEADADWAMEILNGARSSLNGFDGRANGGPRRSRSSNGSNGAGNANGAVAVVTGNGAAIAGDRCPALGRILRRFSLDELMQLWNVLRGEMSLIGPRPERVTYVRRFERVVRGYSDRHRVKSGITGWAQVHGLRGKTSLADRVEWDNYYIGNWSLWLDLKILLLTPVSVFRSRED